MKTIVVLAICFSLTACNTIGGMISGAGKDLSRAGEWVSSN